MLCTRTWYFSRQLAGIAIHRDITLDYCCGQFGGDGTVLLVLSGESIALNLEPQPRIVTKHRLVGFDALESFAEI